MNIFYLSRDVKKCAQWHVDKHVVKMILEYSQLLSTAHRVLDGEMFIEQKYVEGSLPARWRNVKRFKLKDKEMDEKLYKATHIKHPSAIWVRQSGLNYNWLLALLMSLHDEYTYRYGKVHKSKQLLPFLINSPSNIPMGGFTEPPLAMPDHYKDENHIRAYQVFYALGKNHLASWKNRKIPPWFYNLQSNINMI